MDQFRTRNYTSRVFRNDGGIFADIDAGLPGIFLGSVAWGDYDNDGDLDFALTGSTGNTRSPYLTSQVYRNDDGVFTDIGAGLPGVNFSGVAWGDYDNDGDLDLLLAGCTEQNGPISRVYQNDGGVFTDIKANLLEVYVVSAAWGDYDGDGDLDIILTWQKYGGGLISRVYRNEDCADLALTKIVTPVVAATGQTITYTLAFSNAGCGPASGVRLIDTCRSA